MAFWGRSYLDEPPKITTDIKNPPRFIVHSSTNQIIYLFTASGQCATIPVQQLSQVEDPTRGTPVQTLCPLREKDKIVALLSLPPGLETGFLFLASTDAQVKRLRLEDVPGMSSNVFTVMKVGKGAELGWVMFTTGENEIILGTAQAQTIRFDENDVRPTGLPSGGMRGIKLVGQRDQVIGAVIAAENQYVWSITDDGIAKISAVTEFPTQGRAGGGVIAMRLPKESREMAAMTIGRQDDTIVLLTNKNKPKYMRVGLAEKVQRGRAGGDYVISMRAKEAVETVVNFQSQVEAPEPVE